MGTTLIHAKPYDAPARGKMERFSRTLREGCLDHTGSLGSLHDLNVRLWAFIDQHYLPQLVSTPGPAVSLGLSDQATSACCRRAGTYKQTNEATSFCSSPRSALLGARSPNYEWRRYQRNAGGSVPVGIK